MSTDVENQSTKKRQTTTMQQRTTPSAFQETPTAKLEPSKRARPTEKQECDLEISEPPATKTIKRGRMKRMEFSVTIGITGCDISLTLFPIIDDFLQRECDAGMFAVEKGGSLFNLQLQGVIAIDCTSGVDVQKRLTTALDWDQHRPLGGCICVKKLSYKGVNHTFNGMIGYCLKDRQELHFQVCKKGITDAMQREGMDIFTLFGDAVDLKNRVELNPSNFLQHALQYNQFISRDPLGAGTSLLDCLRRMIVEGHYTPSFTLVMNNTLDKKRVASMWKSYVQPDAITMADVDNIFFLGSENRPGAVEEPTSSDEGISSNSLCCGV
ncbi:hypothetical protein R1sor_016031 [Riccia sorocarpa]|uniref:Replitron HUH endonuclease domain-containing protein n=1 Tax=Riccia sorocarpa TaxID=122646 RepID=A0ABD3HGL5_9MARC